MRYFDFKYLMLTMRRLNHSFRDFLEKDGELDLIVPDRVLFYRLIQPPVKSKKKGEEPSVFKWPRKSNYKVCQLANKVHIYLQNEFPETER